MIESRNAHHLIIKSRMRELYVSTQQIFYDCFSGWNFQSYGVRISSFQSIPYLPLTQMQTCTIVHGRITVANLCFTKLL